MQGLDIHESLFKNNYPLDFLCVKNIQFSENITMKDSITAPSRELFQSFINII